MAETEMSRDGRILTVHVPLAFRKRGGRKLVIVPQGAEAWAPPRPRVDNTIVKALARARRWKRMLESGDYSTIQDLADAAWKRGLRASLRREMACRYEHAFRRASFAQCARKLADFVDAYRATRRVALGL